MAQTPASTPHAPAISAPAGRAEALIARLAGPDPEAALEEALNALAGGADLRLLLTTTAALVRSGVPGLAARLLRATGPLAARPDVQAVLTELAPLPPGGCPLGDLADLAAGHRRRLLQGRDHLVPVLESAVSLPAHVYTTGAGNRHVVRDDAQPAVRFVFPFVHHRRHAAGLALDAATEGSSFLLIGVPSPPLLERLCSLRSASGYVPPLDIIEPDPAVLDCWLHLLEDGACLDGPRVGVFAGPNALEQYAASRVAQHWRGDPTHTLTNHRPGFSPPTVDAAFLDRVRRAVDDRRSAFIAEQERRCSASDALGRIRRHLAGQPVDPPLRVLGLTTRFSTVIRHAMRDLTGAFARHGCICDVRTEPTDADREIDTWSALAEETYDLVVVINHLRSELGDRIDARLPYACWIQDQMVQLWTPQAGASVGPRDVVIGRDPWSMTRLYGYPRDRFLPAVNLTDAHTYDATPVPAADRDRYACDVSFVSHGSATVEMLIDELRGEKGPAFAAYLRDIADRMRACLTRSGWVPFFDVLRCMDEAERTSPDVSLSPSQRRHHVYPLVASLLDRMIRHDALEWAASWAAARGRTLRIYGRGWEHHPTLAAWAHGEIDNGYALRCLYQASAVSLQINAYGSHHQRLLDGFVAGGFVLSRFVPLDFRREPVMHLKAAVECHGIDSLAALEARTATDPGLAEIRAALESLDRCCLDPLPAPRRAEEARLLQEIYALPREELTDEAVFESCRDPNLPPRLGGDLPGFADTMFDSESALHGLLDRFVADAPARAELSTAMRADILAHDTYDVLVPRLLAAFTDPEESSPCTGC